MLTGLLYEHRLVVVTNHPYRRLAAEGGETRADRTSRAPLVDSCLLGT